MKLGEKFIDGEGSTFHIQTTYDAQPVKDSVQQLKSAGHIGMGESRHVARLEPWLLNEWAKEAGVRYGSPEHREVIKKKVLSGEFDKLRPWEGTY